MLLNTFIGDSFILILTVLTLIIVYIKTSLNYWKRHNAHSINTPIFNLNRANLCNDEDYKYFKKIGEKVYGIYINLTPLLILIDPNVIKNVMVKDFHAFSGRGTQYDPKEDPLSHHLLFMQGKVWKNMRVKLTPVFSSGKIKSMFDVVLRCSNILIDRIDKNLNDIDIKECLSSFGIDVIGSCAFGMEINSLYEEDSQFRYYGKQAWNHLISTVNRRTFINTYPRIAKFFGINMYNDEIWQFFYNFAKKSIEYREKNNYRRSDFLQILIDMKNSTKEEERLTLEEITAQCYTFFLAGFETSSATLMYALHELAINKDIQDKARKEIKDVFSKVDGNITYDVLNEIKYTDQILEGN